MRVRAAVLALGIAAVAGPLWGGVIGSVWGGNLLLWALGFFVGILAGVYLIATRVTMGGVRAAQTIYNPSGKATPYRQQYSHAQALVMQGKYGLAAEAYEIAALESDGDPEPYFQLARLYRDKLHQHEDALAWFRRARTDAHLSGGQELLAIQEIVALYTRHLGTPRKALPELIALTERFPNTPAAEGAERELAEMREMLARERDGGESFTDQYLKSRRRG